MKKLLSLAVLTGLFITSITQAYAYNNLYIEDTENQNNNPNVDKFVPQSGVKIKPSPLAQMMENATKNAMGKNNNTQKNKQQNQKKNNNNNYSFF